jgi:hypothetical protein
MKNDTPKNWDSAYQEAYELAKNGNPVIQAAVARAFLDSGSDCIGGEEAYRLVREAAAAGFPPAFWLQTLYIGSGLVVNKDSASVTEYIYKAATQGCAEAKCFLAISAFYRSEISAEELRDELDANPHCVLIVASIAVERFIQEKQTAEEAIRTKVGKITELTRQMGSCQTHHREQIERRNAHIRELEDKTATLQKIISTLSASALEKERDALRSELATTKQRLSDAETQIVEANILFEIKVADAVTAIKNALDSAQQERDFAAEERDEALRRAEKSERRAKAFELWMRKNGFDPAEAFAPNNGSNQIPEVAA